MNNQQEMMQTTLLETAAPFNNIFPIHDSVLRKMIETMSSPSGFDLAHPIIVWMKDTPIVLDGHTRLQAALHVGIEEVPIIVKNFVNESEALDYAVAQQVGRRNLTNGDMLRYVTAADKLLASGRPKKLAPIGANLKGKSSEKLAEVLQISPRQAERLRKIAKDASEETKQAFANDEITINRAYNEAKERNKKEISHTMINNGDISVAEQLKLAQKIRLKSIPENIISVIEKEVKSEMKQYPNLHYSSQQRNAMREIIIEKMNTIFEQLA